MFEVNAHIINVNELNQQNENIFDKASLPGLSFALIGHNSILFYKTYGSKRMNKVKEEAPKGKGKVNKRTLIEVYSGFEDLRNFFREQELQFSKYIFQKYASRYPSSQ